MKPRSINTALLLCSTCCHTVAGVESEYPFKLFRQSQTQKEARIRKRQEIIKKQQTVVNEQDDDFWRSSSSSSNTNDDCDENYYTKSSKSKAGKSSKSGKSKSDKSKAAKAKSSKCIDPTSRTPTISPAPTTPPPTRRPVQPTNRPTRKPVQPTNKVSLQYFFAMSTYLNHLSFIFSIVNNSYYFSTIHKTANTISNEQSMRPSKPKPLYI